LLRAILAENCATDSIAEKHLAAAARAQMDPLDYCAHQFGLGNAVAWQRAARWAGYGFAGALPSHPRLAQGRVDRIEHLGDIRSLRQNVLGQDLTFIAPSFDQVLRLKVSWSTALFRKIRFAPPEAVETAVTRAASDQLMAGARQNITTLWPEASAAVSLPITARIGFVATLLVLIVLVMLSGIIARPFLIPVVAILLMAPGLLRLLAAFPAPAAPAPRALADAELPFYSVLIPLRDESQMVPMLKRAMSAIDYPPHRLDIRFVVEAKSPETVEAVEHALGDPRFRMVVVPQGAPHTKPKAIDYALPLARGEFVVVYDAEDVPAPDQLRLAAARFRADPELACLQAELVPENAHENALTALFAGEYAGLFGRLLPALARWRLPVPLGGTSNHFRTSILREIGGWDAFNVTEDADLGVRLARRGLRAETFASRTYEEAPLGLRAWMAQRTRWMKGWMQTYVVHNRAPRLFLKDIGWRGFLGFQVLVGGMILSSLLHTVFIGTMLGRLLLDGVVGLVPQDGWDWFAVGILATGYGGASAIVISGLLHQRAYHLLPIQLLLPVYWILHSIAALYAAQELITKPVHWAKTTHGVTRMARSAAAAPAGTKVLKSRTG
jgi:cellulose synthase/poly-beta-1,6-N-acetylglucosamine synthase-like glycosyltransferase